MDFELPELIVTQDQNKHKEYQPVSAEPQMGSAIWADIVQPLKIIPIPQYMLRYWTEYLSASKIMLILGMRQAGFLSKNTWEAFARRKILLTQVSRWAGMSKQRVSILLKERDPLLDRFFHPLQPDAAGRIFQIRNQIPLTPRHLAALAHLVREMYYPWRAEHPTGKLKDFVQALATSIPDVGTLNTAAELMGISGSEYTGEGVEDILRNYFAQISPEEAFWCLRFEDQIIQPGRNLVFTHYFIDQWLQDLSSQEALILLLLRMSCPGGEAYGKTTIKNVAHAATLWHVDRKTAKKTIEQIASGASPLAKFIAPAADWPASGPFPLRLALWDPVRGADASPPAGKKRRSSTGQLPAEKKLTDAGENVDDLQGKCLQSAPGDQPNMAHSDEKKCPSDGACLTRPVENVDRLIKEESLIHESKDMNQKQQPENSQAHTVVVAGWPIETIFELAGLSKHPLFRQAIAAIEAVPLLGEKLIARLIWAYERATSEKGRGINAPELYVLRHYQENSPALYVKLTQMGPEELLLACRQIYLANLSESESRVLRAARNNGFQELLENLITLDQDDWDEYAENEYCEPDIEDQPDQVDEPDCQVGAPGLADSTVPSDQPLIAPRCEAPPSNPTPATDRTERMPDLPIEETGFRADPQIAPEVAVRWENGMKQMRSSLRIGYNTFFKDAELVGWELSDDCGRLILRLPNQTDARLRSGIVYPRVESQAREIFKACLAVEKIEIEFAGS